jgi:hypothetical protein
LQPPAIASGAIWIVVLGYVELAMRRCYGQGRLMVFLKFGIPPITYTISPGVMMVAAVLQGAATP